MDRRGFIGCGALAGLGALGASETAAVGGKAVTTVPGNAAASPAPGVIAPPFGLVAVVVAVLCAASAPALADWTAKGELGASFASGNSENESANAALEVKNTRDKWTHHLGLAGNYGSDGTVPGAVNPVTCADARCTANGNTCQ
mgnify:CR=1 FL=1